MTAAKIRVRAAAGEIIGTRDGRVRRFLGIPYAEAPIGPRRFAAPVPRRRFAEPFDASRPGATSQRIPLFATTTIPEPSIPGDDVLNLSVVAPDGEHDPLPVLVWIHGGGFLAGSQASPWYDGRSFARDGVVCVTVGYRLGIDGFATLDGVPANLGLRDLLLALDWVRENIATFGGDPDRVTIAGQSAGGAAVLALLSSPLGEGRFRRAVSISGGLFEGDESSSRRFVERVADRLGVPPTRDGFAGCDVERIQRSVLDDVLPVSVADGLAEHGRDVPLLLGATGDEFDCPAAPLPVREAGRRVTDTLFRSACPRTAAARSNAEAGTWLYSFEWPSPVYGGSAHCVDVPFFFDVLDASGVVEALGPNPPAELAAVMHGDLVRFIRGEEPSWSKALGRLGDPAREYGPLVADTTGVFDPVTAAACPC
jgi:para-nitrobenzyl esterase